MRCVAIARGFGAYPAKPPQAHERIPSRLFSMDENHNENNHRCYLLLCMSSHHISNSFLDRVRYVGEGVGVRFAIETEEMDIAESRVQYDDKLGSESGR